MPNHRAHGGEVGGGRVGTMTVSSVGESIFSPRQVSREGGVQMGSADKGSERPQWALGKLLGAGKTLGGRAHSQTRVSVPYIVPSSWLLE